MGYKGVEDLVKNLSDEDERKIVVMFAIACTERCIHVFTKEFPNDSMPCEAIEVAKKWIADPSNINIINVINTSNRMGPHGFLRRLDLLPNKRIEKSYRSAIVIINSILTVNTLLNLAYGCAAQTSYEAIGGTFPTLAEIRWRRNTLKEIIYRYNEPKRLMIADKLKFFPDLIAHLIAEYIL